MKISSEECSKYRVLLVDPDAGRARGIAAGLELLGLSYRHVTSHLKAMAVTEDDPYACLFVAVEGDDVSGLEFCSLLRARESRRQVRPAYVILIGGQADLVPIVSSDVDADDYLIDPWMDMELIWKVKRAVRVLRLVWNGEGRRLADSTAGLLTSEGLKTFLFEEVNRVGRRHGWFSLSVLSIPDHAGLRVSFGDDWLSWFKSGIWDYLGRQLRNYDRLATLDGGMLCLISPDLDETGTRTLLARLSAALDEYQVRETAHQETRLELRAQFLCVRVLGDYKQFSRTGDVLWNWLQACVARPLSPGVVGSIGQVAQDLELCPEPVQGVE